MTDTPTTSERLLPDSMPGHWDTPEGAEMAREYAGKQRTDLHMGDLSDLVLANAQYMQLRDSLLLGAYQTAAKERIRWLSAQLALAKAELASRPHPVPSQGEGELLAAQIKHMVDRFLMWKLPDDFNPDGGISFQRMFNEHTPWPRKAEPVGTNLFDAQQAEAMVRHMLEGMPVAIAKAEATPSDAAEREELAKWCDDQKMYCRANGNVFGFDTYEKIATALRTPHGLPGEEELVLLMRQNLSVDVSNYGLSADIEGIEDAARAILSRLSPASREDGK